MSSFTNRLTLTYLPKKNMWRTERSFTYCIGEEDSEDQIIVPEGFETDLASVPWPACMFITRSGRYNQAAVLHDYLYHCHNRKREDCDCIFLEAMEILGVSWWKRKLMFRAVRMGGWLPWKNHIKRSVEDEKKH